MSLRNIGILVAVVVVAVGFLGWKIFTGDIFGHASNAANTMFGSRLAEGSELGKFIHSNEGLVEAVADVEPNTIRARRSEFIDPHSVQSTICTVARGNSLAVKRVRVYANPVTDFATTSSAPELDQACP